MVTLEECERIPSILAFVSNLFIERSFFVLPRMLINIHLWKYLPCIISKEYFYYNMRLDNIFCNLQTSALIFTCFILSISSFRCVSNHVEWRRWFLSFSIHVVINTRMRYRVKCHNNKRQKMSLWNSTFKNKLTKLIYPHELVIQFLLPFWVLLPENLYCKNSHIPH